MLVVVKCRDKSAGNYGLVMMDCGVEWCQLVMVRLGDDLGGG